MSKKTDRLVEALVVAAKADGEKDAARKAKIRAAAIKAFEKMIAEMDTPATAQLFADLESATTASGAKLIAQHELRPAETDAVLKDRKKSGGVPPTAAT